MGHPQNSAQINRDLLRPIVETRWPFYVAAGILGAIVLYAGWAWAYQIKMGIGVAGISRPVHWGFYITNFVFYIGISHAGTLISAILRLSNAGWRRPVTRCAEAITVFALMVGALFPLIHLGRVWKFYWLIPLPNERDLWPNFRSPLLWDFMAINTYLIGSVTYLYIPMIPDLAVVRDKAVGWRKRVYGLLALGWRGTQRQWHRLEKAIAVMAVIIVPVAVSVHTVVSFDFAMALQPMWHSTIFGPLFVCGAIFSGIAALIIAMVTLRKVLHLEAYLQPKHFSNLGLLLLTMSLLWFYFTFAEYLTVWYGNLPEEMENFWFKLTGPFAPWFWGMVIGNFVIPVPILAFRKTRTITGCFIASVFVLIGMWLERFVIVVGSLSRPRMEFAWGSYAPTWVEISIMIGTVAYFILLYVIFAKLFPIVSIWEFKEGQREAEQRVSKKIPAMVEAD
jgi:molybdopterin-containing oxidoreductase family membrane subunit